MTTSSRPPTPQALFSRIAPWYDLVNVIVSAGYDGLWRRKTTELISLQGVQHILDLACGTGAMGAALRHRFRAADIVGLDVNQAMLEVARKRKGKFYDRLMRGDVDTLPFGDAKFDAVVVSLAFHDFHSPRRALTEIYRVLKPNGSFVCMELSLPIEVRTRTRYKRFLRALMIARNILGLRKQGHVLEEILNSPESSYIVNLATSIGFESVSQNELSRGIVTNYLFRKEGVE